MIVLDNDVLAGFARPNPEPDVLSYLSNHRTEQWIVPSIVLYEFLSYYDTSKQTQYRRELKNRIDGIAPFDEDAAAEAATMNGALAQAGTSLDTADLFIAAIATAQGGTLATRNYRDFDKTPIHQLLDVDIVR